MAITTEIMATYRAPRAALRRQMSAGLREDRALIYLFSACALIFVSSLPNLARQAYLNPEVPLDARIGGALLGWVFFMPLLAYALAALSHVVARALGGQGGWFGARLALFWAMLAAVPLWLLHGLVAGFIGPGPALTAVSVVVLCAFFYFWVAGLIEAEAAPLRGNAG